MGHLLQLRCPRCQRTQVTAAGFHRGCPSCADEGVPVNFVCDIDWEQAAESARSELLNRRIGRGIWSVGSLMPLDERWAVPLGEGETPLLPLARLGTAVGAPGLHLKMESQNPTWSHKDRLAAAAVAAARAAGARVVTTASTGNHGAATAAFAARAGLECVILTLASVPATMKTFIQAYGAHLVAAPSIDERNRLILEGIERYGWYPASNVMFPPIGSNPFGVDGYKSIAYELWWQLEGRVPDWIVVPVAYGDCLAGIWRGFQDLLRLSLIERAPRVVGAEVFGPLESAVSSGGEVMGPVPVEKTRAFSIGGPYTTYQALTAIRESDGLACPVLEEELVNAQLQIGREEGLYVEAASAVGVAAVRKLAAQGRLRADDVVVSIVTSSGLKDPAETAEFLPPVPVVGGSMDAVVEALREIWKSHPPASGVADTESRLFAMSADATGHAGGPA
jgi:threonine synthase